MITLAIHSKRIGKDKERDLRQSASIQVGKTIKKKSAPKAMNNKNTPENNKAMTNDIGY